MKIRGLSGLSGFVGITFSQTPTFVGIVGFPFREPDNQPTAFPDTSKEQS